MQTLALDLVGDLDSTTVDAFRDAILRAGADPATRTIVVLSQLAVGELPAFFAFVDAMRMLRREGRVIYLVTGNRRIRSVLQRLAFSDALLPDDVLVCVDRQLAFERRSSLAREALAGASGF